MMNKTIKNPTVDMVTCPKNANLAEFLNLWDTNYKEKVDNIPLFNTDLTSSISEEKKHYFVKAFYHIRGHFHDFLWFIGNHAPSEDIKKSVTDNINEEFGGKYQSHEQLYILFAESLGVDIQKEIISEAHYDDYIIEFNKGHLRWLHSHSWVSCYAAFSAYEHLDNIDYILLSSLAASLGASGEALKFFKIHEKVTHYDALSSVLANYWHYNQEEVIDGFNFIGSQQIKMWNSLSDRIFN
jgi:hypothetical protein